ncbi:MAG: MBOAT family protein [Rhodospirillales bacterium]|nr:MBOAT family protein [Rhodospirillales bacterium]
MLFHSQPFILGFLPLCLGGFFLLGRLAGRVWALRWLVCASFAFYAWWRPPFVLLLAASIALNYLLGQHILRLARAGRARPARRWLIGGVALNLGLLGWFKYADFLLHTVAPDAPALHLFLPLAISFFTFQQIMFLVDSARCDRQDTGALPYAAFIAFFPHLIAGPIVRPKEIIPQLTAPDLVRPNRENLTAGLMLFLLGLAKKLVLADTFGSFADRGFDAAAAGEALTFFEAWYAALAYALQIYFDFSGYSDMAIGLARMLNVRFPLNFDSPYQAASITAFWRRWHMTLSRFLRDYLYIPLGGSRAGQRRRLVNLMLTMLLGGLWHGAAWTFVLWGGLHGLFLVVHAAWTRRGWALPRLPAQALTLLAVTLAWVPFRADGMAATWAMLRGMAGANGIALPQMLVWAIPPLGAIATGVPVLPNLGDARTLSFPEVTTCLLLGWAIVLLLPNVHAMSERMHGWTLTAGFALSVQALFFAPQVAPFLYFQF